MSLSPFSSQLIADVGISFGDEGKGRLIPEVVEELRDTPRSVSTVLKVNGGANSGHTAGGIKLNLLPAGVVENTVKYLGMGAGVVADPRKIWWETRPLEKKGYSILPRLVIDEASPSIWMARPPMVRSMSPEPTAVMIGTASTVPGLLMLSGLAVYVLAVGSG